MGPMTSQRAQAGMRRGFTLIELLVVMAITTILLGLIFGPLVQSFNLTNRARVQVLAQATARAAMETLQRDLANGVFVFDEMPTSAQLQPGETPLPNSIRFWVRDNTGAKRSMLLPYAMLDLVPPARANDQNAAVPVSQIDPTTGLPLNRGDLALPVAPGRVIVRYFLGLRDNHTPPNAAQGSGPAIPYGDYYDNPRDPYVNSVALHNPMILYRAVVSPYLPDGQVDRRLFHVDANGRPILYDPDFFCDASPAGAVVLPGGIASAAMPGWKDDNGDGRVEICENWRAVARPVVPVDRADEILLQRDDRGNVLYDANTGLPRPALQVRLQPAYVGNDAGAPSALGDVGNESPSVAPASWIETNGAWVTPYRVFVFRSGLDARVLDYFLATGDGTIHHQTYDTNTGAVTDALTDFQLDANGQLPLGKRPDLMFTVDVNRGIVNFAFPDWVVLHNATGKPIPSVYNTADINKAYATAYAAALADPDHKNIFNIYRYISLASLDPKDNPDIGQAPAPPRPPLERQADGRTYIPNVRIVPGSEVVIGPDMRPGPHYGQPITYTRVPRSGNDPMKLGPNEYMINYTDMPNCDPKDPQKPCADVDPSMAAGTIIFDSQPDPDPMPDPNNPDGKPRMHWLPVFSYDSNGNLTAPAAKITVTYKIQNNLPSDVVKSDYLTRQLMTVAIGVRLFDLNSGQPQQATLTQQVKVRDIQR